MSLRAWLFMAAMTAGVAIAQPSVPGRTIPGRSDAAPPRFEDFPAQTGAPGRNAPVILTEQARTYRTRLRAAAGERPNFGGHYILVSWGCGTECLMGAAINAQTGRAIFLPFATCCISVAPDGTGDMVTFRRNSALIRLVGFREEQERSLGTHYYRAAGDRFEHVRSIPFPARR